MNWLLVQVAFSNPVRPILISYLKPASISPLDPNMKDTGRSAMACTEVISHPAFIIAPQQ